MVRLKTIHIIWAILALSGASLSGPAHAQLLTGFSGEPIAENKVEPKANPFPVKPKKPTAKSRFLTLYDDVELGNNVPSHGELIEETIKKQASEGQTEKTAAAFNSNDLNSSGGPVDLQADLIERDENTGVVSASGDVVIVQDSRILRADRVSYDVENDKVIATGDVVLNEESGDIYTFDKVELTDGLKNGFVERLLAYMADGARFTASNGRREAGKRVIMKDATYSPCEICEDDPDSSLVWRLRASEVIHDQDERRITYDDVRFEFFGIPIFYTPYFSHADGSVKQKSGFLSPSLGYKSSLGAFLGTEYYWAIAPDRDLTIGLTAYTKEAPLLEGEWRQRWDSASMQIDGGITYSGRTDSVNGVDFERDEDIRGHVFAEALWDMNDKWRSGFNIEYASDDQYLRQYDISSEDVLENEIYAERFSGRNYAVGRLVTFQDVRVDEERASDQPEVLPEIIVSFIGDPNGVPIIGGRWDIGTSFLGLRREGDEQDMNRFSFDAGWNRRLMSDLGFVGTIDASLRGDFYNIRDRDIAVQGSGRSRDGFESRFFPQIHTEVSYPVARPFERFQAVIEPVVALSAATDIDNDSEIPNEDSQDVQIDTKNLFSRNRFPGLDRVEDKSRVTYGLRSGVYGYDGSSFDVFLGQSYRFEGDDNPFPNGSGLNDEKSDVVGEVNGLYDDYTLNYRFQLSGETLNSQRHEVDAYANFGRVQLGSQYLFAKALGGTDIDESREQVRGDLGYYFTPKWRGSIGAIRDLGAEPGLRQAYGGLEYFGQCISWGITAERNLTEDSSGDSGTEVFFRIGLKNLSDFEVSQFSPNDVDRYK